MESEHILQTIALAIFLGVAAQVVSQKLRLPSIMGTSKNAQMSPNRGSGRDPASGFWRSVAPERLI